MEKYSFGIGSKGITFIESLMKICQLAQSSQLRDTYLAQWCHKTTLSLLEKENRLKTSSIQISSVQFKFK